MRNPILLLLQPKTRLLALRGNARRNILLLSIFTLLLFTGVFTDYIYLYLDRLYYTIFSTLGWTSFLNLSQGQVSSLLTMRSWPTMLTYGFLYTSLSFLFLHIYFNRSWKSLIAAGFYFVIFMACTTLILTGKMLPEAEWAYKLCRRLIEMVVSPLPIILLIAALAKAKF